MMHRSVLALSLLVSVECFVVPTLYPNGPFFKVHRLMTTQQQPRNAASKARVVFPNGLFSSTKKEEQHHFSVTPPRRSTSNNTTTSSTALSMVATTATTTTTSGLVSDGSAAAPPAVPFPIVLWRFTRPHTLIGSALAVPALHLLAAPSWQAVWTVKTAASMAYAMVPALLMNLYITGLNQVTDVAIDKINKPNLPIAAGLLSSRDAVITCVTALVVSLAMGSSNTVWATQGLNVALWGSAILGTLYSLEPFRLKRFPLLAAFCIVAVRGTIINASFFAHAKAAAFGVPTATVLGCLFSDPRCLFSSAFFGVFGVVIALMKDVPDVLGDKVSNVRTFAVRVGPQRIFHASRRLLTGLFVTCGAGFLRLATTAATPQLAASRTLTAICSLVAGLSVRSQAAAIDPENPGQVYKYYMHLWKIFYLCYLVLPLAR
jgi:homogentisate phytyltransferase / homogentisate geranylgeranyltransferase